MQSPEERKAYRKEWMAKKRSEPVAQYESVVKAKTSPKVQKQAVDLSMFSGRGRGVPVNGYVLVAGNGEDYVVKESDWLERLQTSCLHGLAGWSCKLC